MPSDLLTIVIGVGCILALAWIASFTYTFIKIYPVIKRDLEQSQAEQSLALSERSPEIIGRYYDLDIAKYVISEGGRKFVFESVAVRTANNLYYADKPSSTHLLVDGMLLYREVDPQQE